VVIALNDPSKMDSLTALTDRISPCLTASTVSSQRTDALEGKERIRKSPPLVEPVRRVTLLRIAESPSSSVLSSTIQKTFL